MRLSRKAGVASVTYLAAGLLWVFVAHPPGSALALVAWLVAVACIGCFVPGEANQVSLARAYLAAPGFAYASQVDDAGILALVVALAGLTDLVDGTVARRFAHPSTLGGGLDPVVDGLFMGAVVSGLVASGVIPAWLAAVVVGRYLLPALAGALLIGLHRRPELRHTLMGQVSTSLILILVGGVALFRGLKQDPGPLVTAAELVIPIATAATFVHLAWVARRPAQPPEGA
ncbi:MAG: CDP-alcohol phosphatidyltransferase family protein [Candidatus Dormibacterales bacterium]